MPKKPCETKDVPFALIALIAIAVWIFIALPLIHLPEGGFASRLHEWQTLVGATVALVAAGLAYFNTTRSLAHSQRVEEDRRARKHAALRATLPLALADINHYAGGIVTTLLDIIEKCDGESLPKGSATDHLLREPPTKSIDALAQFIEFSEPGTARVLEATVARIQINDSRLRSLVTENTTSRSSVVTRHQLESYVVDCAIIYAGAASFFSYARRALDEAPAELAWDSVARALRNMGVYDEAHPRIFEDLNRRRQLYETAAELRPPRPFA
ncbi:hypothetical protein [Bradyrhizobium sp. TM233]|uniref:hypothetical protein n=1 Tax=Bradyrhizobium sp. TM233 TaxID=2599801 RepID=UPI0030C6CABC